MASVTSSAMRFRYHEALFLASQPVAEPFYPLFRWPSMSTMITTTSVGVVGAQAPAAVYPASVFGASYYETICLAHGPSLGHRMRAERFDRPHNGGSVGRRLDGCPRGPDRGDHDKDGCDFRTGHDVRRHGSQRC